MSSFRFDLTDHSTLRSTSERNSDKKSSFAHLDPLWYTLYSENSNKEKVLNWIKKKDVFSRKYVVFPIVQWGHWSLLIFCHFGESLGSKLKTPCILLLDSLEMADHSKQVEPVIRKFVLDIYRNLERKEETSQLRKIPFLVPKMKKDWFSYEGLDEFCRTLDSFK
ncbi:Peptidase C48, SUMO/Sentrin/Ubl1 [Cynara cardunculus var. scolymus]|uniref:Peptidase C48, SUMO/Sentrin/Ubl1 n=1 Tax=Cynara cardunculus var. scolymus TaxID=59895 RepID=A0A103YBS4_CYNCS|nr:Peptidase C48, SUMO/Sentrin/Ubl1 [Cynara cardunculus var. scolymus]